MGLVTVAMLLELPPLLALLFDVPRTATVTVAEDAEFLTLQRTDFLTAVTGHPQVASIARQVARARMSR